MLIFLTSKANWLANWYNEFVLHLPELLVKQYSGLGYYNLDIEHI